MDSKEIKLEVVTPSKDIGRCCICGTELATKVLTIERVQEIRFCDKCFNRFKDIITINMSDKNKYEKLLNEAKAQYAVYTDEIEKCRPFFNRVARNKLLNLPKENVDLVDKARERWHKWVNENITKQNLILNCSYYGNPESITKTISGILDKSHDVTK